MLQITMTAEKYVKNPSTKNTYILESIENETIDEQQYRNITSEDTVKYFRRLGGSETVERGYTCYGYKCTKLTSTSPDKSFKTVRKFKFEWL